MEIKRGNTVLYDVYLKDNSYVVEEIMGEHTLTLNFLSRQVIDLQINDYVEFESSVYKIRYNEKITKRESSLGWEYTAVFYSSRYDLQDVQFFLQGKPERKKNVDYYTGTAGDWLALLIKNMNRIDPEWKAGSCIESEWITLSFKDKTVGSVLDDLVKQLNTEYWISGKTLNIGRREYSSNGLVLGQGEGMGFTELEVSAVEDTPPVTVLYPYGSDKNLGTDYGADYLVLPGGQLSIEKNVEKYGRFEVSKQFDNIYPEGEFIVTEKIDATTLQASGIDFNLTDCLLKNDADVIVTFQTGGLAGYDLAIVEGSWDNATKQFKLKQNEQENALKVPGDINFSVGDKFILTGLKMPQSYIDRAEQQLLAEAEAWLNEHSEKHIQLRGKCDEVFFRLQNLFIACGQMVGVYSEELGIDREIRVTRVKRSIENDGKPCYRYELTLSDFLQSNGFKDLVNEVNKVPEEIEGHLRPVKEWSKRSWRDVMETLGMMFDPEGDYFTDLIKPLVVRTAQLIVGTNSQQMDFIGVKFIPNADNDPNYFKSTAGRLVHFTIREEGIAQWQIPASAQRLNNSVAYYVYAKCPVSGNTGSIVVSEQPIKLEEEAGYYHFWIGVLNTPEGEARSWNPNYGYTEIAGQTITTGVIKDKLSRLVIDLINGTISGPVTFTAGSSGYNNLTDRPNLQPLYNGVSDALTDAEKASNAANSALGLANTKSTVYYNRPSSGMEVNDLWCDGINIYRWNGNSWETASMYDNTSTRINGGLITTGAIAFGSTGGMASSGTVRIWSGGTAASNGQPPSDPTFKVYSNGRVYTMNSFICRDINGAEVCGFSSEGTDLGGGIGSNKPGSLRIWAGIAFANKEEAGFRVYMDGSIYTTGIVLERGKTNNKNTLSPNELALQNNGTIVLSSADQSTTRVLIQTRGGEMATPLHIIDKDQSGTKRVIGPALKIDIGQSKYIDIPRIWIDCGHALGYGSEFRVESRYMGDANGMERTVIKAKLVPKDRFVSTGVISNPAWKVMVYDENSGYIGWQ